MGNFHRFVVEVLLKEQNVDALGGYLGVCVPLAQVKERGGLRRLSSI